MHCLILVFVYSLHYLLIQLLHELPVLFLQLLDHVSYRCVLSVELLTVALPMQKLVL